MVCLNHACGTLYYYDNERPKNQENSQAHYELRYGVSDHTVEDIKNQWEVRKEDKVKREYLLLESYVLSDKVMFITQLTKHHGFKAVATRDGKFKHNQHHETYTFAYPEDICSNKLIDYLLEYPEETEFNLKRLPKGDSYKIVQSKRKSFHAVSDIPPNHSPSNTGISVIIIL